MSAILESPAPAAGPPERRALPARRVPWLLVAVLASRLLVLGSGAAAALLTGRVAGWQFADPTRLTQSFGRLGNVLLAASVRWDSLHYLSIAQQGYRPAADTGFFPFYPLLIRALSTVLGSGVAAGLLISYTSLAIALTLLHRLTREELGRRAADATVLLLAFAPLSVFFSAIYTESLFLALSVGTIYLARRGHFAPACLTAACGTLTHAEGMVLFAPLAHLYWVRRGRPRSLRPLIDRQLAALCLPPLALAGLSLYMRVQGFGWLAWITGSHATGHGHSIAPLSSGQTIFVRSFYGPLVTVWDAFTAGVTGLSQTLHGYPTVLPGVGDVFTIGFQNLVYLVVLVITLAALYETWRRLPAVYAIYATFVVLLFTASVVAVIPLRAFDRYMLPAFPLWMSAAGWLTQRRLLTGVLVLSALLSVFYTVEFSRWAMIA